MPDTTDLTPYDLPLAVLIDTLASDDVLAVKPGLLTQLRKQQGKARAAFEKQRDNFDKLYEEVAHSDADSAHLVKMAEVVLEKERAAAERLRPGIEALQEKLVRQGDKPTPEIREYFQESLDIAVGWLELYDNLRSRLLKFSSDRRHRSESILRARPVAGDIDYAQLTREFMARFPKILAALAK